MEDNKIDKHGNINLKTMDSNGSQDNTNTDSLLITPRKRLNKSKLHLKLEDVIDTK